MFRGRYQLGGTVPLLVLTRDGSGTPAVPDRPPQAVVWSPAGARLTAREMPVVDRFARDGLFGLPLFLTNGFAEGLYTVTYHYVVGSYHGLTEDNFEVAPGGHADGAVLASHFLARPQADFIVQQLESGRLVQGRNPRT